MHHELSMAAFALQQRSSVDATGTVWPQSQKYFCLVLYQKGLPTLDLDDCGICLKKKKKENKEDNLGLHLSQQRETVEISCSFPDSALVPVACHLSLHHHDHYCKGHLFGLTAVMPQTAFAERKEKLPESVSLR